MVTERETSPKVSKLSAALTEAENIIEGAKERANSIVAEAEAIKSSAKREGLEIGKTEALSEVAKLAIRLICDKEQINELLSQEAAKLALAITSSILEEELKQRPEAAINIARKALKESVVGNLATLIVNPQDRKVLEEQKQALERITQGGTIQFVESVEIARGGCRVVTEFGEVDATISALTKAISEQLGI